MWFRAFLCFWRFPLFNSSKASSKLSFKRLSSSVCIELIHTQSVKHTSNDIAHTVPPKEDPKRGKREISCTVKRQVSAPLSFFTMKKRKEENNVPFRPIYLHLPLLYPPDIVVRNSLFWDLLPWKAPEWWTPHGVFEDYLDQTYWFLDR